MGNQDHKAGGGGPPEGRHSPGKKVNTSGKRVNTSSGKRVNMKPKHLKAWRMSLPPNPDGTPVSRTEAARLLNDTPPNSYIDWEAGRRRIPRMLPLACYAVAKGWRINPQWLEDE